MSNPVGSLMSKRPIVIAVICWDHRFSTEDAKSKIREALERCYGLDIEFYELSIPGGPLGFISNVIEEDQLLTYLGLCLDGLNPPKSIALIYHDACKRIRRQHGELTAEAERILILKKHEDVGRVINRRFPGINVHALFATMDGERLRHLKEMGENAENALNQEMPPSLAPVLPATRKSERTVRRDHR
ncbi:MAG TPA: hypothetical protein VFQ60_02730 [Patescibacteria group bacterium]|nr:hypothetical protein [Patescibacteria group bacterium]